MIDEKELLEWMDAQIDSNDASNSVDKRAVDVTLRNVRDNIKSLSFHLLPCPCCGSEDVEMNTKYRDTFHARCEECGVESNSQNTKAEVARIWNREPEEGKEPTDV